MNMQEVRKIANKWGVDIRVGRSKQDIIRDIQAEEGFTPCFRTKEVCDEYDCLWRKDCIKE
ncbi:MAG: SAP domain-containing protein [Deltaproteobacteria bacterium]|nr:SAP domain-containing protein [Deltaproteobacteria bacterium]